MKNAMQLKAIIKNIAKNKNISTALVLQNYMLERFLERVSLSRYHDNYIIKGGYDSGTITERILTTPQGLNLKRLVIPSLQ